MARCYCLHFFRKIISIIYCKEILYIFLIKFKLRTYGGLLDDVLFEVTQFDNLDLYHHLISYNLVSHIHWIPFPHVRFYHKNIFSF